MIQEEHEGVTESLEGIIKVLPEPSLLVSGDGEILICNAAAAVMLNRTAPEICGRYISEFVFEPSEAVTRYLEACSRSRQMVLGAFTWILNDGEHLSCRCEGAVVRPWSSTSPAVLLVRLKRREVASKMFVWLNQEIDRLSREIHLRKEAEAQLATVVRRKSELLNVLRVRETELRELNATLEHRVRERTKDLTQANRALEQRNRELQDFAYVASHDLKEPLRKIITFAGLLRDECREHMDEQGLFYLERIEKSAVRMSELLVGLLNYSRIATHGLSIEPVDLNEIASNVLADLEIVISDTNGHIEFASLPTIEADPVQMRQLLQNLISNALKFHRDDVPPRIRVWAEDGARECVRLLIQDNGIGFDEKYLDRIFGPFQRLHGRHAFEGTGMGLAICRRIVERHGGTITARSRPDLGSTFIVTLPTTLP